MQLGEFSEKRNNIEGKSCWKEKKKNYRNKKTWKERNDICFLVRKWSFNQEVLYTKEKKHTPAFGLVNYNRKPIL